MRISDWSSDVCSSDLQGRLSLDLEGWHAHWAGAEVPLTVTEFSILRTLASMPAKVFSRDAIIDRLHGPGFAITDRPIARHIRNLRAQFVAAGGGSSEQRRVGQEWVRTCDSRVLPDHTK